MRYRKRRRSRGRRRMKEKKEGYKLTEKKVEEASKEKIKRYTKRYNGRRSRHKRVDFGPSIKLLAPHETVGKRKCCDTQSVHGFSPHFTDFFPVRFSLDRVLLGFYRDFIRLYLN